MREAKAERAELRATVKDLLQSSSEAELPRHAAQVMQAGRRDMGGLWPKPWEIVGFFYGKNMGKPWVSCRFYTVDVLFTSGMNVIERV